MNDRRDRLGRQAQSRGGITNPRAVTERFRLGLRFEDRWGNPFAPEAARFRLHADGPVEGLPETAKIAGDRPSLWIAGLSIASPGTVQVAVLDAQGAELALSNPIIVEKSGLSGYWGDLHGQSGETIGIGTIDEYMAFARDTAFLDVTSHQGNDFQITSAFWGDLNEVTSELNQDGEFTVFPGYEWSGNTPVGGDHNVYFRHEGAPLVRSSHAMLVDRTDIERDANTVTELFDALQDEDCVLWAHVGGRPADVSYAHDPKLRTAVEVHSN